jgi:biopolymer transport protein ExbB/TolQ
MRAAIEHIGRKARCPWCKSRFEIKAGAGAGSLGTMPLPKDVHASPRRIRSSRSTDANPWLSGLIGLVAAGIIYAVVLVPLRNTYVGILFVHGGPVSVANTIITSWGLAALALKYLAVKRQVSYAELELDLIPLDIGLEITPTNVDQFLGHLRNLGDAQRNSILGRRIHGALEHFKSRNSVPEVQQYLATQAEIDASSVDSGYTMLRTFIWANPILGFIGTVVGISFAVAGLSTTFASGAATENLMRGLGEVTSGLSTAFDTTLIGLLFAMLLMFPTESLRKTEYGMLDRIEAFANESLLRRMSDERGASLEEMPVVVRDALEAAFREHQRWLAQWQSQVGELGQVIGRDFEQMALRVHNQLTDTTANQNRELHDLAALVDQMFREMRSCSESWMRSQHDALEKFQSLTVSWQPSQTANGENATAGYDSMSNRGSSIETRTMPEIAQGLQQLMVQIGRLVERMDALLEQADQSPQPDGPLEKSAATVHPDGSLPPMVSLLPTVASDPAPRGRGGLLNLFRRREKK